MQCRLVAGITIHKVIVDIFATLTNCHTFNIRQVKQTGATGYTNEDILTRTIIMMLVKPQDAKFRENKVLTCPAGCSYHICNHNDGVEDYSNQTDDG